MGRAWIDVSVSLRSNVVCWPGDRPASIESVSSLANGDGFAASWLSMHAHTGTHVDAPAHMVAGGATVDEMPAGAMVSPALVVEIHDRHAVHPAELTGLRLRRGQPVLFKTANSARSWASQPFSEDFVHVSTAAARFLVARGVSLVGVDYLSVGGVGEDGDETHRILLGAGIWVVEGLDLSAVRPGRYDMVCTPLRIAGGDGAPARVLLRPRRPGRRAHR